MVSGTVRVFLIGLAATYSLAAQNVSIPLYFEQNRGQFDREIQYIARDSPALRIFKQHEVLWQSGNSPDRFRMAFENPARSSVIEGLDALPGKVNYLLAGGPQNSIRNVDCYSRIRYRGIFPGVDIDFRNSSGALEYDVIVSPGADPASVRFLFSGAKGPRLTDSGDLVFETSAGTIRHHAPVSWQLIDGTRRPLTARFVINRLGADTEVGFQVDSWDHKAPLTIDPIVYYDQTVGGSGGINNAQIQVDSQGYVYVAGATTSLNLPVTTGAQPVAATSGPPTFQPYAAKLRADGSGFVYITYFALGTGAYVTSLAIDAAGDAYMAGSTASPSFPVTQNAVQRVPYSGFLGVVTQNDGFVFALNPSGSSQTYGTYLGGSGNDSIYGMVIASDGTIWLTGTTYSLDFPVTSSAFQSKLNGPDDAFLTHIDPASPTMLYSTYFGGSGHETAEAIAIDAEGGIYIGGATDSADFPVTSGALQTVYGGGTDVFLAKFATTTPAPVYATYWGGVNGDILNALAADSAGSLYAAAETSEGPINLTGIVLNNAQVTLMKLDPTGSHTVWSSSPSSILQVQTIAVDSQSRLSVFGRTTGILLALTSNALSTCPAPISFFLLQLEADGKTVSYASGVPGSAFAMDSAGTVYFTDGNLIEKQDFSQNPAMAATCILGATEYFDDAVAPGEIISIYGRNLGPTQGVIGALDSSQRLPFILAGVSITFNGTPAPLLYAQAGQINAIVPFEVVGQTSASLQITFNATAAPAVRIPLRAASNIAVTSPGNSNLIAAINQDGTINSYAHPAPPGSIVAIFSSGGGQTSPPSVDGQIATAAANLVLPVQVLMGFNAAPSTTPPTPIPAQILYAGAAPGLLAGTVQINFRVPLNLPASVIGTGYPNQDIAIVIGNETGYSTSGAIFVQ